MEFYKIFLVALFVAGVILAMALIDYILTNRKSPFALLKDKSGFMQKVRRGIIG